ncbi:glycosyltransferase [Sutcliffiella horikoshii]|uniref:glycosyltransferase n=1 Tax=Sutcliffiella horikoshii TaxID=79883 RepID=UPI001CFE93D4|nr:glycosyltransferase [Sutcliffiella horikoshii]
MSKTPTISLCMIVKNEEKYLKKCLTSVMNSVDEIVIVDTGSTDATLDIAREFGARIYQYEWNNDFSEARNHAINYAEKEYILILDADECIELHGSILKDLKERRDYYVTKIKNFSSAGFIRYHEAIRIFKNNIGLRYFGKIHEHINIEETNKNYSRGYTNFLINHEGYKEEVVTERNKIQRNLQLLLKEISCNPSGYNFFNLAKQYKQMGKIDDALECFKNSFNLSKLSNYKNELLFHIIDCLRQQKRYIEALRVSEDAIFLFPNYTDIHFIRGRVYFELDYWEQAEESFRKCISIGEVQNSSTTEGVGDYWSYYYLSEVLIKKGDRIGALENLMFAIKSKHGFYQALEKYVRLMTEVNIEANEIFNVLSSVHKIETREDILNTVQSLYFLRNPLLFIYTQKFNLNINNNVLAVAYMYGKKYNLALELWNEQKNIPEENKRDVLLLSIILKSKELILKLECSPEEKKFYCLMANHEFDKVNETPGNIEKVFLEISEGLLKLKEYKTFFEISKLVPRLTSNGKYNLSKILYNYGFYKQAAELLLEIINKDPLNIKVMELLGDIFYTNDNFDQSLFYFSSVLNVQEGYSVYFKLYKLYIKFNKSEASNIKSILNSFPSSQFLNVKVESTI